MIPRTPERAFAEAEGIGDVLCFLEEVLGAEQGGEDMVLSLYGRRGLVCIVGDCSRRMGRLFRYLDALAAAKSASGEAASATDLGAAQGRPVISRP